MVAFLLGQLIEVLVLLVGASLVLRAWLQWRRIQPTFEIARGLVRLTQWWVGLFETVFARAKSLTRTLISLIVYSLAVALGWMALTHGELLLAQATTIALLVVLQMVRWWTWVMMLLVLVASLLSWVGPSPQAQWIVTATQPLLKPLRRWIKPFGQLDIVPLLVFLALNLFSSVLTHWFHALLHNPVCC